MPLDTPQDIDSAHAQISFDNVENADDMTEKFVENVNAHCSLLRWGHRLRLLSQQDWVWLVESTVRY